jgi:hypothetical protein
MFLLVAMFLGFTVSMHATTIGSITVTGNEKFSQTVSAIVWDTGNATATINGYSVTVAYGQYSTPISIASALAAAISQNCGFPVYARADGAVINFSAKGTNIVSSAAFSSVSSNPTNFPGQSFPFISGSGVMINASSITLSLYQGPSQMGLVINGSGFGAAQGNSTVRLNGIAMSVASWSDGAITVQVPVGAESGNIVVTVNGVAIPGAYFTVSPSIGCPTS